MSFSEFIAMGYHGFYVWTSYGVSAVLFIALYLGVKSQNKSMKQQLKRRYSREELSQAKEAQAQAKEAQAKQQAERDDTVHADSMAQGENL